MWKPVVVTMQMKML